MTESQPTSQSPVLYCWDTTVFLAWINEETSAPLSDIEMVVKEIDSRAATLIVPVTIVAEILDSKLTDEQRAKLDAFLKRSNVVNADTTLVIAKKARAIRDAGLAMKPPRKIKTPDATIIATAIIYGCDALHSLDDRGNGPLKLSGTPAVESLRITKPVSISGQRGLNY